MCKRLRKTLLLTNILKGIRCKRTLPITTSLLRLSVCSHMAWSIMENYKPKQRRRQNREGCMAGGLLSPLLPALTTARIYVARNWLSRAEREKERGSRSTTWLIYVLLFYLSIATDPPLPVFKRLLRNQPETAVASAQWHLRHAHTQGCKLCLRLNLIRPLRRNTLINRLFLYLALLSNRKKGRGNRWERFESD